MRINDDPENDKCPFENIDRCKCHAYNSGICMNGFICEKDDIPPVATI